MIKLFIAAEIPRSIYGLDWARGEEQEPEVESLARARDDRYRITFLRTLAHCAVGLAPITWRERLAERFLRRKGAPAPASEHVVQYLLSAARGSAKAPPLKAVVARGADEFYDRQYRQTLNPVMGAFAMTATQALVTSGAPLNGRSWTRYSPCTVMLDEESAGGPPIIVLNTQTVAVPVLLPRPHAHGEYRATRRWLAGNERMPASYRDLARGKRADCCEPKVRAFVRNAEGFAAQLLDAVAHSGKLAVLALHPFDPDAMGLHITLFGVQILTARVVLRDYGMQSGALDVWRWNAQERNKLLVFCVGGTEEIFTQCSQNLFVKRRGFSARAVTAPAWTPAQPLENLLDHQFELFQATVSSSGLPGASPRNGLPGKAAFVEREAGKTLIVIPYHPGNAMHGHAAKLWSNPMGSLVVWDDAASRAGVTITGPCQYVSHAEANIRFAASAAQVSRLTRRNGSPMPDPEYWFVQEVGEVALRREPLALSKLDSIRSANCIAAGGHGRYNKKPAYFAASSLPRYDMEWQHEREAQGRPTDPSGRECLQWREAVHDAIESRLEHLGTLPGELARLSAHDAAASPSPAIISKRNLILRIR